MGMALWSHRSQITSLLFSSLYKNDKKKEEKKDAGTRKGRGLLSHVLFFYALVRICSSFLFSFFLFSAE